MKGIILAGGRGTRLYPMTTVTNKHLLPVYNKPMIYYPIQTLIKMGIDDIMIVTGKENAGDFLNLLGSGRDFGVRFTYRLQEEADGIAGALSLCQDFVSGEKVTVILGDNIFEDDFSEHLHSIGKCGGAMIFVKKVSDPSRFGVVSFDENMKVEDIEEKPKNPKTKWVQTGLYIYDCSLFEKIQKLKPSERGEYEITDVNLDYLKQDKLKAGTIKGLWSDAGTPESLLKTAKRIRVKTF